MDKVVLNKLKIKYDQLILIINAPNEFKDLLKGSEIKYLTDPDSSFNFALCFAKESNELKNHAKEILDSKNEIEQLWFAYPKKSSKKYKSDITRDTGWEVLGEYGFEPVMQISIDEDWSALRFKKIDQIKNFSRLFALSEKGKERISKREEAKK